jgi:hypothetical protein
MWSLERDAGCFFFELPPLCVPVWGAGWTGLGGGSGAGSATRGDGSGAATAGASTGSGAVAAGTSMGAGGVGGAGVGGGGASTGAGARGGGAIEAGAGRSNRKAVAAARAATMPPPARSQVRRPRVQPGCRPAETRTSRVARDWGAGETDGTDSEAILRDRTNEGVSGGWLTGGRTPSAMADSLPGREGCDTCVLGCSARREGDRIMSSVATGSFMVAAPRDSAISFRSSGAGSPARAALKADESSSIVA